MRKATPLVSSVACMEGRDQVHPANACRSSSTPFDLPQLGQPIPGRSRARSFSLGKISNSLDFLEQDLDLGGPAAEREASIRADLANKAEQVRALSPCQHGKARAVWAKRWYV